MKKLQSAFKLLSLTQSIKEGIVILTPLLIETYRETLDYRGYWAYVFYKPHIVEPSRKLVLKR